MMALFDKLRKLVSSDDFIDNFTKDEPDEIAMPNVPKIKPEKTPDTPKPDSQIPKVVTEDDSFVSVLDDVFESNPKVAETLEIATSRTKTVSEGNAQVVKPVATKQPQSIVSDVPNREHLEKLNGGVAAWNLWRLANPQIQPDLRNADLRGMNLSCYILDNSKLSGANLAGSNCWQARFIRADLRHANLSKADFRDANLENANFENAKTDGMLTGEILFQSVMPEKGTVPAMLPQSST
ncbi:MAG: pentapeptide repeat-containing protein [Calditrichia bacterium]